MWQRRPVRERTTRAAASMDKAAGLYRDHADSLGGPHGQNDRPGLIFAVGNAPTALIRLTSWSGKESLIRS